MLLLLAYDPSAPTSIRRRQPLHHSDENFNRKARAEIRPPYASAAHETRAARWRALDMYTDHWHERVRLSRAEDRSSSAEAVRKPRRVVAVPRQHKIKGPLEFFNPRDGLQVLPREINTEQLPSTPQLNSLMDRALTKVKEQLYLLEMEKGRTIH